MTYMILLGSMLSKGAARRLVSCSHQICIGSNMTSYSCIIRHTIGWTDRHCLISTIYVTMLVVWAFRRVIKLLNSMIWNRSVSIKTSRILMSQPISQMGHYNCISHVRLVWCHWSNSLTSWQEWHINCARRHTHIRSLHKGLIPSMSSWRWVLNVF